MESIFNTEHAVLECVTNFSEGQDLNKIKSISEAIEKVVGIKLLHVDIGYDANRTVMTFAGKPESVVNAAFEAIAAASKVIDMTTQTGTHPRLGATDVCPLIPIKGITIAEVIRLSHQLAKKVGDMLQIPVYLYEESSTLSRRKNLEDIRKGEYEGLAHRISRPEWKPDYGPAQFNPISGATIIGARNILIAYNINLSTKDISIAKAIAKKIRAKSKSIHSLPFTKAIGWYMDKYGCCQVSTNLTNYHITNLHDVYERCKAVAKEYDVEVTGSELIGLVPLEALIIAGGYYLGSTSSDISHILDTAVFHLGLDALGDFIINERVIEYVLDNQKGQKG